MIAVLIILFILSVSQLFFTLALSRLIVVWRDEKADHAKCIAVITEFIGNDFAARVLDSAAADYNSMDGRAELARLVNTRWKDEDYEGDSVPAMWLRERADQIRP